MQLALDSRHSRAILALIVFTALAFGSLPVGSRKFIGQTPDPFSFAESKGQIPDSRVTSPTSQLKGFNGRLPVALSGDDGVILLINGERAKPGQSVKARDRVAIQLVAGDFGETRQATLTIRDMSATFVAYSMTRSPSAELVFGGRAVAAGQTTFSNFVAPSDFTPGALLESSSPALRVIRKDRKDYAPVALDPGEIFQLAHPSPEAPGDSIDITIILR